MPFSILTFLPIWTHPKLAAKARHSTHLDRCLGLISIPQDAWRQINCQKETRVYCTAMDESQTTQMLKSPQLCLNKMETLIHRYSHPLLSCSAICKINFQTKDWYLLTIANTSKISLSQMLWHSMVWSNSAFWTNPYWTRLFTNDSQASLSCASPRARTNNSEGLRSHKSQLVCCSKGRTPWCQKEWKVSSNQGGMICRRLTWIIIMPEPVLLSRSLKTSATKIQNSIKSS